MGYSYSMSGALCCDSCGQTGGVRKRTCPYTVSGTPYCPPPAYCRACYSYRGGLRGVHTARCKDGAASMQAADDARQARLDAGELAVWSAIGSGRYSPDVPPGWVRVTFIGAGGPATRVDYGVPDGSYDPGARPYLTDYTDAVPWADVPRPAPAPEVVWTVNGG